MITFLNSEEILHILEDDSSHAFVVLESFLGQSYLHHKTAIGSVQHILRTHLQRKSQSFFLQKAEHGIFTLVPEQMREVVCWIVLELLTKIRQDPVHRQDLFVFDCLVTDKLAEIFINGEWRSRLCIVRRYHKLVLDGLEVLRDPLFHLIEGVSTIHYQLHNVCRVKLRVEFPQFFDDFLNTECFYIIL